MFPINDSGEAHRVGGDELAGIAAELLRREPIFHRLEFGTTRSDFEEMMAEEFWETGASGRRYSRAEVLEVLEKRHATAHVDVWEVTDFDCRRLAHDLYLVTYTLLQDGVRLTRRLTIWRRSAECWKIEYHQGTIVEKV